MRTYPCLKDETDMRELLKLNAEDWQIECLKKNPEYVFWGNTEGYMNNNSSGWDGRLEFDTIKDGIWTLDEYNEVVNFYFEIIRDTQRCDHCNHSGLNKETAKLSNDWYTHSRTDGKEGWMYHLEQEEVNALWNQGRLKSKFKTRPTVEQVNNWARTGVGHDDINQWICLEIRSKKLGIYGKCEYCNGEGIIYTSDKARLALQLWYLHPRKGSARGVYINNIQQNELPEVIEYLKEARQRNYDRFSKL